MQWNSISWQRKRGLSKVDVAHRRGERPVKLQLSKILPASPEEVFELWLDPESVKYWMCPGDTSVAYIELDPRVEGAFRIDMRTPSGEVYTHTGKYLEIQPPRKLVFTWISSATANQSSLVTIMLFPHDDGCRLELTHERLPGDEAVIKHRQGWADILELLTDYVRGGAVPYQE
jgi:uncharacterized protein YndB with AHSA1/START domain